MNVTRKSGSDGNLTKKIQAVVMQGREDDIGNQRTRSAVMGVRGLDESGDTAFAGNVRPNMRLVYMMEDLKVDNKKVEALGDLVYAEISQKLKR
jgi:ssDNA-binding replication factor A large subunit